MTSQNKNLSPREELLCLQKNLFRRNQRFIEDSIFIREKGFEAYQRRYLRQVSHYSHVANIEELKEALKKADIIFVGDYHTNKQSQRGFLRILKMVQEFSEPMNIALELIHRRYQSCIDEYLTGKIQEKDFLEKINLKKRWYFDLWKNFQPIFEFASYHHIPIFGVEAASQEEASLQERDKACAKQLSSLLNKNAAKLLVLIGDLHIAPQHLPRELSKVLKEKKIKKNILSIYQNSEKIYWQLAEKELEEKTEIVRIDSSSFCMLNTPPIIWQQSYLNWLEHEEGEIDFADAKHSFLDLADRVAGFLEITLPAKKEEVEVYTSGDLSFLKRLEEDPDFTKKEIQRIKKQIARGESYYFFKKKIAYLGNLSLNHSAEEASHFIRHLCAGEEFEREPVDAFYANILHEALGFFGSKLINHHRKCFHEKDFSNLIDYLKSLGRNIPRERILELEIAFLFLQHLKFEKHEKLITSARVIKQKGDVFFGVTHALGYRLGDRLYYGMMAGKISKEKIRELYFDPFKATGKPGEVYLSLIKKLGKIRLPRRV